MTIHGLIFDFGGVITNMRWDVARDLEERHGLERNAITRALYENDEWRAVEVGRGDVEVWFKTAHENLERIAGKPLPPVHIQWRDSWELITENVELIEALRPHYRVAILSNADASLEERIRDGTNIHHLFDTVVCSGVVGIAKPDHRVYRLAAERLGLPPEECVFIDDAERNVTAAREVGMAAVRYRVYRDDDLAAQLAELGVQPKAQ